MIETFYYFTKPLEASRAVYACMQGLQTIHVCCSKASQQIRIQWKD